MKKHFLLSLLFNLFFFALDAQEINEADARLIGRNFLFGSTTSNARAAELELAYRADSRPVLGKPSSPPETYFYIYNTAGGKGFVIVAANESATPILAYSDEGAFDPDHIPQNVAKWLDGYKQEIASISRNGITATNEIRSAWNELRTGAMKSAATGRTSSVSPMIKTKWDQSPFYNELCPFDTQTNTRTVTGCVATAMAQIMKYWNYPKAGSSFSSYSHDTYGTLSANYGATTYKWESMPNVITSSNTAISTLMYHCGVSVEMDYGPASSGGSGAYQDKVATALKKYFLYSTTAAAKYRSNYTETTWKALLKSELDAGRPIQYAGSGSGGGHSFVCDGYDDNELFHFNWGWGGNSDGYYSVNALNPSALGTGGGTGGFNSTQHIIIGIQPPAGAVSNSDMKLFSAITVNPAPVIYKSAFTVTVNLTNTGTTAASNFTGDIAAAAFNSSGQFVGYVETKTGMSLAFNSHYTNPLVFSTTGIEAMIPGDYTIGIYYKPTGATDWIAVGDGSFQNFISTSVLTNVVNPLKLYAAITTTPSPVIQGQSVSIKFDVLNSGNTSFTGDITIDLHASDGTWIRTLAQLTGTTMAPNTHYSNGLVATLSSGLSDAAGTYKLFAWSKPSGGTRSVLGSGSYSNPVNILLLPPPLVADAYEVNNTVAQAFLLPVTFSGNNASKTTTGSNCHNGADYDYYKMTFPAGMDYTITPRIHDLSNSTNGTQYTLDAVLSYSLDGTTWSDAYDAVVTESIMLANGGTIYFLVAPFFSGEKGTYLMDVGIVKSPLRQSQTISFSALPNKFMGDDNFSLTATASSNLTVSYTSSNPAVATVSGSVVTLIGAGTTTITATQAGNGSFYAAAKVTQTLTVVKKSQTITFSTLPARTLGEAPFNLTATASSTLPITYVTTSDKITINGSQVTIVKVGKVSITASQVGNATFLAATSVDQSFCIKPVKPGVTISGVHTEAPVLTSNAATGNQWFKNGTAIAGATQATLTVKEPAVYKVQVTLEECSSDFSNDVPIVVTGDLLPDISKVSIYPDPAENYIEVAGLKEETSNASFIDMTGRSHNINFEKRQGTHVAPVQHLASGIYILRIEEENKVHQLKFWKK